MSEEWIEVRTGAEVIEVLGLDDVGELALAQLLLAPASASYLRVEATALDPPPGEFTLMVPRSRYSFNVSACRELRGDVIVALGTYLATHSAPASTAIAVFRKLHENLKRLTPQELELVRVIMRICPGNPYEQPVSEADVRDACAESAERVDELLDSLQGKGVLAARRGGQVKLTY